MDVTNSGFDSNVTEIPEDTAPRGNKKTASPGAAAETDRRMTP